VQLAKRGRKKLLRRGNDGRGGTTAARDQWKEREWRGFASNEMLISEHRCTENVGEQEAGQRLSAECSLKTKASRKPEHHANKVQTIRQKNAVVLRWAVLNKTYQKTRENSRTVWYKNAAPRNQRWWKSYTGK